MSDKVALEIVLTAKDITGKAFASLGANVSKLRSAAFSVQGVLSGIGVGAFAKNIFDAGVRVEGLGRAFTAIAGKPKLAADELDYVRSVTKMLGTEFYDTADAYAGIFAASQDTLMQGQKTRDIFLAITSAGVALGKSQADIGGMLDAVTQMMSKGKVSAEELRGQLGERLPGAFKIAADAMGVSTAQLDKMLVNGELLAEDLLPRMARALQDKYGNAAKSAGDSALAASNRMATAWVDMSNKIAQSGFMEVAADVLDDFSKNLSEIGDWTSANKKDVISFFEGVGVAIKGMGVAAAWTADKVGWIPGWMSDLGAGIGMVAGGAMTFDQLATANREDLRRYIESFDLTALETKKKSIEIAISGLRDQLDVGSLTKNMFNVFEPDYLPDLERQLKTKLIQLKSINQQISELYAPKKPDKSNPDKNTNGDDKPKNDDKKGTLSPGLEDELKRRKAALAEFNKAYNKTFMSTTNFALHMVDEEAKHYKELGVNKVRVDKWATEEKKKILDAEKDEQKKRLEEELEEKKRATEQFVDTYNKATMSTYDYAMDQLNKEVEGFRKTKQDEAMINAYYMVSADAIRNEELEKIREHYRQTLDASTYWRDGMIRSLIDYRDSAYDMASGVENAVGNAFSGMEDALVSFVKTGKLSFTDLANGIIADMARIAVRQAITAPLAAGLVSVFSGWAGTGTGSYTSPDGSMTSTFATYNAKGNIFDSGIKAFAKGGVFSNKIYQKPTVFRFGQGGSFGVMGEAGAEAVMPLVRTSSGDLGVRSNGGSKPIINVTINNQATGATGRVESMTANESGGLDLSVIIEQIDGAMASGIGSGRSALSGALESQYGLNRAYGSMR